MTIYPLALHGNQSPLGLNPAARRAPRLPYRCIPCLGGVSVLPTLLTVDVLPSISLEATLPGLESVPTLPNTEGYTVCSEAQGLVVLPSISVSDCC